MNIYLFIKSIMFLLYITCTCMTYRLKTMDVVIYIYIYIYIYRSLRDSKENKRWLLILKDRENPKKKRYDIKN